ncbi:hypothetical protein FACS1894140_3270 [Spirochaetia bacterium]|nr:hypothetical protein FACS1894140_3270 [Spirochaetia bacterium]
MDDDVRQKKADECFCRACGAIIKKEAEICPHCGVRNQRQVKEVSSVNIPQKKVTIYPEGYIIKSKWTALILCLFLGSFGAHRFYIGRYITGILMIGTLGGLGLWVLIDFIVICCNALTDRKKFALAG